MAERGPLSDCEVTLAWRSDHSGREELRLGAGNRNRALQPL